MPRANKDQLIAFWDFADTDKDGKLTESEFRKAVLHYSTLGENAQYAPPDDNTITELFKGLNKPDKHDKKDEYLTRDEYFSQMEAKDRNEKNFREAFKAFDTDGDGTISAEELRVLMVQNNFSEQDALGALQALDRDGDGKISFEEFFAKVPCINKN